MLWAKAVIRGDRGSEKSVGDGCERRGRAERGRDSVKAERGQTLWEQKRKSISPGRKSYFKIKV